MEENAFHRAIYLTGPTASGKTAVGVALSRRLDAEVIAMDSVTIYRRMDIGTAKPTIAERGGIPHHLIDVIEPWESASVADYRGWAREAIRAIEGRGKRVLFVGGTPLYLKALLRGLFAGPGSDAELRGAWSTKPSPRATPRCTGGSRRSTLGPRRGCIRTTAGGSSGPWRSSRDPAGRSASSRSSTISRRRRACTSMPSNHPRAGLYERIDRRVLAFFDAGLVEEVRSLQAGERPLSSVAAQAIGYREVIAMLAGQGTLAETIERVQVRSRQFAKRQGTWFRGLEEVEGFPVMDEEDPEVIADRLAMRLR